jgi:hypothetical protein
MENQVFERQIFKVGDRVFDAAFGWGEVKFILKDAFLPINVFFPKRGFEQTYTLDGRLYVDCNPTLSFTEYTLEGFSQEKPIKFPCTGMFEEAAFGICFGTDKNGYFISEFYARPFINFQPMTFEEYCKLNNIKL